MTSRLTFAAACCVAALAAAPAAMAQDNYWAGPYVGLNGGVSWGNTKASVAATRSNGSVLTQADIDKISAAGTHENSAPGDFTGGAEAGYNWQWGGLLLGVETDFEAFLVSEEQSVTLPGVAINPLPPGQVQPTFTLTQHASTDWMWTLRPRIGYASGPWLFYGTLGLAVADIKNEAHYTDNRSPANTASISNSATKAAMILGLGGGYAFSRNWSAKAEWLWSNFGSVDATATSPTGFASFNSNADVRAHLIRVGMDYRF